MLFFLVGLAMAQECEEPTTSRDLLKAVEATESAYSLADGAGFQQNAELSEQLLPCLGEPLSRAMSARYHRVRGLAAFLARDEELQKASLSAARWVQPRYVWPADLVPMDHPVREAYDGIDIGEPALLDLPPPKEGELTIDGQPGLQRPTAWPTIVQHFGPEGDVRHTWYLPTSATNPEYEAAKPPKTATTEAILAEDGGGKRAPISIPLIIGAG
ncbi:MAG: hypothetical protein HN348_35675, partial [Proteobacteria bacterium]|nr:hypothetical protein [Pseudomonadota bacterium]